MSDKPKTEPFQLLTEQAASLPPRPGPTMVTILEMLTRQAELTGQILRRQQQTALMVDGFAHAVNRRFDVMHEETALLRVALNRPANDTDATVEVDVETETEAEEPPPKRRARKAVAVSANALSYLTTAAVVLRLVGKQWPEYESAIDSVLAPFGL